MKVKGILLAAATLLFADCASKAPTFSVAQTWTEKPTKLTVVFTEPVVENQDDLKDDIEEYANNFGEWFKQELKKDYELYIKGAIALDYQKVDSASMIIETDHVDSTEFKTPKPASMEQGNGYYLAISNVIFSRREDAHANQAYYSSGAAFGANVNPGQNSMAFAGERRNPQQVRIRHDALRLGKMRFGIRQEKHSKNANPKVSIEIRRLPTTDLTFPFKRKTRPRRSRF